MSTLTQNTAQWLAWRRDKIGASDIAIILGLSPYSTPLQLWRRKLGFEEDQQTSYSMQFGHDNESRVREMLQQRFNVRIDPETCVHPEIEWASCSLDGVDSTGMIYEIKCISEIDHEYAKSGEVPTKYYPQIQWQMFVKGTDKARYCSFNKNDLFVLEVERDDEFIKDALIAATEFYRCLVEFIPPELTEKDYVKITDDAFGLVAVRYREVKQILDEAEIQEKELKKQLVAFTDDSNCEGYGLRLTRIQCKGAVDYEKLCKDRGITQAETDLYRKEQVGFWKISAVK